MKKSQKLKLLSLIKARNAEIKKELNRLDNKAAKLSPIEFEQLYGYRCAELEEELQILGKIARLVDEIPDEGFAKDTKIQKLRDNLSSVGGKLQSALGYLYRYSRAVVFTTGVILLTIAVLYLLVFISSTKDKDFQKSIYHTQNPIKELGLFGTFKTFYNAQKTEIKDIYRQFMSETTAEERRKILCYGIGAYLFLIWLVWSPTTRQNIVIPTLKVLLIMSVVGIVIAFLIARKHQKEMEV